MAQDYFSPKAKGKGKAASDAMPDARSDGDDDVKDGTTDTAPDATKPAYIALGSGTTSEHAARLQSLIDNDSVHGSCITKGEAPGLVPGSPAWDAAVQEDRFVPSTISRSSTDAQRRSQASAVHQLWYNLHRQALARSINTAVELLKGLQEKNASWPAHYPTVQRSGERPMTPRSAQRPNLQQVQSTIDHPSSLQSDRSHLRRSMTTVEEPEAESSKAGERRASDFPAVEPRLVTPQIAQEFSILKLDLKLGHLGQAELVHSLEKASIASLLDGKISTSIRHLLSLRDRIEDISSKVLITGDLNAGKSTFCNALLRRKILPEDQQPCTSIFCEVLDARESNSIEEVHAVHRDMAYDRNNESTYDVFALSDLEKLVVDNKTYLQCKVYVKDARTIDQSLLHNGVVDIALIDAPGLNSDTTKTTAVFARQEEIDVVVFVVSAANHFTISAKEFIWAAAAEKAYIFIVVNGFDGIRDKERCQKMILDQVKGLSPRTYKEASELVHFVSSNAVPTAPSPPSGGSANGGGGGDDPGSDPEGKGKDKEKIRDFENLEQSLRRFVLEKRARSKLAPAKNYLVNILGDVHTLATVNMEVAEAEIARVNKELAEIEPALEANQKAKFEVGKQVETIIEETCQDVYENSRAAISFSITHIGDNNLGVSYPGLLGAFTYADALKEAMLAQIAATVTECEETARTKTVGGVNAVKQLGILHLGDVYINLSFRPDVMFRRRRDALARLVDVPTELWDFVDWPTLLQHQEKFAGTGMALTVATAVGGRLLSGYSWMDHALSAVRVVGPDNLHRLVLPGVLLAAVAAVAFMLQQIPHSLPPRLAAKVAAQLSQLDYVHANSARIAGSVRKVLRFPADALREDLNRSVETLGQRREDTLRVKGESEVARKYFGNLVARSSTQRAAVEAIDLEAQPPAAPY